jgi:hypothetical protein
MDSYRRRSTSNASTLALWYGLAASDLTTVFPNIGAFATSKSQFHAGLNGKWAGVFPPASNKKLRSIERGPRRLLVRRPYALYASRSPIIPSTVSRSIREPGVPELCCSQTWLAALIVTEVKPLSVRLKSWVVIDGTDRLWEHPGYPQRYRYRRDYL